jgi:hypothetical protein
MANETTPANTPAPDATNNAPAPAATSAPSWEQQRQAIMSNPLYFKGDGPESKALREQMKTLVASAPAESAAPKKEEVKTKPEAPANDARRHEITRALADRNTKPGDREKLLVELRSILAAQETDEEKTARGNLTVREQRREFGVKDAPLHGPELESYNQNFAGHETALFDVARENGLEAGQVRGLRDEAIKLGQIIGERGQPATADELKQVFDRLKVPVASRPALLKLWRSVEGGGA